MGYVIPPGFSRVSFEYDAISAVGSKPTWGFGLDRPPSQELVDDLHTAYINFYNLFVSNGYTLTRIIARSDVGYAEWIGTTTGPVSSAAASPSVTPLVKAATGQAGRTNRGRIYPVGILTDNSVQDDGSLDPSAQADIQTMFNQFFTDIDGLQGAAPVILHSTSSDPTPVTSLTVQGVAATQRRRLRR